MEQDNTNVQIVINSLSRNSPGGGGLRYEMDGDARRLA